MRLLELIVRLLEDRQLEAQLVRSARLLFERQLEIGNLGLKEAVALLDVHRRE